MSNLRSELVKLARREPSMREHVRALLAAAERPVAKKANSLIVKDNEPIGAGMLKLFELTARAFAAHVGLSVQDASGEMYDPPTVGYRMSSRSGATYELGIGMLLNGNLQVLLSSIGPDGKGADLASITLRPNIWPTKSPMILGQALASRFGAQIS